MLRINTLTNTLTEYIMMKTKNILTIITVIVALLAGSCEKEDNSLHMAHMYQGVYLGYRILKMVTCHFLVLQITHLLQTNSISGIMPSPPTRKAERMRPI